MTDKEFDEVSKSMRDEPMIKAAHSVVVLGWNFYQARMHWEVTETSIKSAVARLKKKLSATRAARERKGKLPKRADNEMWLRSEVNDWDANIKKEA